MTLMCEIPRIVIPRLDQANAILDFRAKMLHEEFAKYTKASQAAIASHLEPWSAACTYGAHSEKLAERLNDKLHFLRIMNLGDRITGYCAMLHAGYVEGSANHHMLQGIYIAAKERGKGFGRRLIETFDALADPSYPIRLTVFEHNKPAQEFYAHLGFEMTKESETTLIGHKTHRHEATLLIMQRGATT